MAEGVSCLCLTYGRPALLEEAVESFLRQRWRGPKELVVVNDHPEQELLCDHPEVRVFNFGWRLPCLGAKRNLSAALARYDHLLLWDDDDIHLPWRVAETMKVLPAQGYFKCPEVWRMRGAELEGRVWEGELLYHGACAYTRRFFEQSGGYAPLNGGEDQEFERRLRGDPSLRDSCRVTRLPPRRLYYIRRWNHGSYHASGCVRLPHVAEPGRRVYRLRPHWKTDYCAAVKRHVRRAAPRRSPPEKPFETTPTQDL
jgi:glycosyltransferase involved in cell wall biosynthesis